MVNSLYSYNNREDHPRKVETSVVLNERDIWQTQSALPPSIASIHQTVRVRLNDGVMKTLLDYLSVKLMSNYASQPL